MRHYVQYHNPDKRGEFRPSASSFRILTDKQDDLIGNTVWLVRRRGNPPQYILCENFVVERVGSLGTGSLRNFAEASFGQPFNPPKRIDDRPWFEALRTLDGNFAFGLQPINDKGVIQGLLEVASEL